MSPAVVQKKSRAAAEAVHQQIQIAIAIDVREHGAGGRLIGAGDARFRGDLHKLPVAEVAIKRVEAVQAAKVEIAQTVAVHVPGSDAGAVQINLVRERALLGKRVGKKNARLIRGKSSESGFSLCRKCQRRATITFVRLPIERAGAQTGQGAQGNDAIQLLMTLRHASENNIQPAHGLRGKAEAK